MNGNRFRQRAAMFAAVLAMPLTAVAHNLDTRATSISFAKDFVNTMSARAAANTSPIRVGDEFWVVIKTTPGPGTQTGVGGYQTFYVPSGMHVVDAAYVRPATTDPRGFVAVPMKGQSPIAIGDGPIGAKAAVGLTGYTYPSANILGVNEAPVTSGGISRGTIAGVYADTGIFYSTDSRTAFNTYGAAVSGGNPPMINNSGDTVGEWDAVNIAGSDILGVMTLWDSYQLRAFGRKDVAPIIDNADGRGNAPWGMASAVAGPQSGYKWSFNYAAYVSGGANPAAIAGAIEPGPWNRVKYDGSQVSKDQAGLISTVIGYAGIDASSLPGQVNPTDLANISGINAIRFAIGQLELGRSEYSAVKVHIDNVGSSLNNLIYGDAFGGDAGGTSNGKDHIWRYFDPTVVSLEPSTLLQKVTTDPHIAPNGTTSFNITFANLGLVALPNVVLTDVLPSGLTYLSAVAAPNTVSGSTLVWNVGTVQPGQVINIALYVKAGTTTGALLNTITAASNGTTIATAYDTVDVGVYSLLREVKTVDTDPVTAGDQNTATPGQDVTYTITVYNDGPGPNGVPLVVTDMLPAGFTYKSFVSATVNGATVTPTINSSNTSQPAFSLGQAIQPDKTAVIAFKATVGAGVTPGTWYNGVKMDYEGKEIPPIPEAPVIVGGASIGDTVFRDWNGNGSQDTGEEGMAGVTVTLYRDADNNGSYETLIGTKTTDANGYYLFTGLAAGKYQVSVPSPGSGGVPAAYTLTADPDGTPFITTFNKTLTANEVYLGADWGYKPGGTGTIGDQVFEDLNKNGTWDSGEPNIPNVTVSLYEDTNGNGIKDAEDVLVATTATGSGGTYSFTNLDTSRAYLVQVDQADADIGTYFSNKYGSSVNLFTGTSPVAVAAGFTTLSTADFGFWRNSPASIGDQVYWDKDGSGTYNSGDTPLANVTVKLYASDGTTLLATTSTAVDGTYHFTGLSPGTYVVKVDTADPDIPSYLTASTSQYSGVVLTAGQTDNTRDFPFVNPGLLTKTVDKSQMTTPGNLTFTLTPHFTGNSPLTNATVTDTVPTGTSFVSAGQGGSNTPPVTWSLGSTTGASNGSTTISGSTQNTISYVASTNASDRATVGITTLSPTKPSGAAQNDLLIAGVTWNNGNSRTITPPVGWTQIGSTVESSGSTATIAYRASGTPASTRAGTSLAPGKPSGTLENDLMIAALSWNGGSDRTINTVPSGWNLIRTTTTAATISYVAAASQANHHVAPTCPIPTGTAAGDILIAAVEISNGHGGSGYATITTPTDWTFIRRIDLGTSGTPGNSLLLYWRVAVASTPTPTWADTLSSNEHSVVGIVAYRGVDPVNPIDAENAQANASSVTVTAPSITTTVANTVLVGVFASSEPSPVAGTTSMSNKRVDVTKNLQGNLTGQHVIMGDEAFVGPGSTGTRTATMAVASVNIGALIALKPAKHGEAAYYKVAGASEPSTYTWGISASEEWSVGISAYSGVDTANPINADAAQGNARSTSAVTPNITTTVANTMLVGIFASKNGSPTAAAPSGMAERSDFSSATGEAAEAGVETADVAYVGPGSPGAKTATLTTATISIGHLIALKPGITKLGEAAYYHVVGASETGPYTFTISGSEKWSVGINAYHNVDTSNPIDAQAAQANASSTSDVAPTITTATSNTRLVGVFASKNGSPTASPPGGLNERLDFSTATGGTDEAGIEMYDDAFVGPGATGTRTATLTAATLNVGHLIALKAGSSSWSYSTTTALSANRSLVTSGDSMQVTMTLTATTVSGSPPFPISVTPGSLSITGTGGASATFGAASSSPLSLSSGVAQQVTYTSSALTPGSTPGVLTIKATPSDTNGTWGQGTANTTLITPPLTLTVNVPNPHPNMNVVTNTGYLYNNGTLVAESAPTNTSLDSSIGDYVWADVNGDGLQAGESGISGVRVYLDSNNNSQYDVGEPYAISDYLGAYRIYGLAAGTYTARYDFSTVPTGYVPTTATSVTYTLSANEQYSLADFGLRPPAASNGSIGDYVWLDANNDGVQDGTESGIANVTVKLYRDVNGDGTIDATDLLVGTTITNASGGYGFSGLPIGSGSGTAAIKYLVQVDTSTLAADMAATTGTTNPRAVSLYTGAETVTSADFGYNHTGSIGDYVWWDDNANGNQDETAGAPPGGRGIAGAIVMLYVDANNNGIIDQANGDYQLAYTTTDAAGAYHFNYLPAGNYLIDVYEDSITVNNLPVDPVPTTPNVIAKTLAAGEQYAGADFGYYQGARVDGYVFWDANRDTVFESGESPIYAAGPPAKTVTVTLTGTDMFNQPVSRTVQTDANGHFVFIVPEGNYHVTYTAADVLAVNPSLTDFTTPTSYDFHASPGEDNLTTLHFGVDNGGRIGDTIFDDADGNGSQGSGEAGLPGVTVELYLDNNNDNKWDSGDTLLDSQVTGATGTYQFVGLADGNYLVKVLTGTLPSGYNTTPTARPSTEWVAGSEAGATISGGNTVADRDFGYQPTATTYTVSGNIWKDDDGNGSKNGVETNIANVAVTVSVNGVPYVVTTDSNGNYTLAGVPGTAAIIITVNTATLPNSAYVNTGDPDGVKNSTTSFTMSNANVTGKDFGYQEQLGSIAGTVVAGLNGNGMADGGEAGLAGAAVTLRYAGADGILNTSDDTVFTPQTTGIDGTYNFTGLLPGLYQISEANPSGYISWADRDGGNPDIITATLATGQNLTGRDFEDTQPGTISGMVQADTNGDGSPDVPLEGVILSLLDASGNPVLDGFGTPITATTAAVTGAYSFTNLLPGNYRVAETQPSGYGSLSDKDGGNKNLIGDVTLIAVTAGTTNADNNFLEFLQACPDTWAAWQAKWGPIIGAGNTGLTQNPDGDRYDNLTEYAFCMPPNSGVLKPFCLFPGTSAGTIDGKFRRTAGGTTDVTYYLQSSASLTSPSWSSLQIIVGTNATVVNNGDGTETVTISDLESKTNLTSGEGFVRMRVDHASQTSYAEVLGWTESPLNVGCTTYNNPYLRCSVFTGTVGGVSGQVLNFSNSAGSFNLGSVIGSGNTHYLEVVSGSNAGQRFDVSSASGNTVTVVNDSSLCLATPPYNTLTGAPPDLTGSEVVVRPHWTLGVLFPVGSFTAAGSQSSADQVQTYANGAWTTYWLYSNSGSPKWVKADDGTMADQVAAVIPPGQGMFVNRRSAPALSMLAYGEVRENDFVRPLCADGAYGILNLVGGGFPIDQSARGTGSRQMNLAPGLNGMFGSRDFKTADSFFLWKGDAVASASGYDTYYLLNNAPTTPSVVRWVKVGDASLTARDAETLLSSDRAAFIRVKNDLHTYRIPLPWTPASWAP